MENEIADLLLNNISYFINKQNTSELYITPIKINNEDFYLYKIDCIKCLLQMVLYYDNNEIFNNLDNIQNYKDFIIKYARYYNDKIKDYILNIKFNIPDIKIFKKLITTDELLLLTNKQLELYIDNIYTPFDLKLYKINKIAPNYIDYSLYIINKNINAKS